MAIPSEKKLKGAIALRGRVRSLLWWVYWVCSWELDRDINKIILVNIVHAWRDEMGGMHSSTLNKTLPQKHLDLSSLALFISRTDFMVVKYFSLIWFNLFSVDTSLNICKLLFNLLHNSKTTFIFWVCNFVHFLTSLCLPGLFDNFNWNVMQQGKTIFRDKSHL